MFFKKKKIKKQSKTLPYILGFIGVFGIFFLGTSVLKAVNEINFKIFDFGNTPTRILDFTGISSGGSEQVFNEEVKYILLTGKGGGNHDAPNLTDTIILAGIHPKQETITLFSIPRDLYVKYPGINKSGKINQIYETFLPLGEDVAIEKLETKITEITGQEVDYYINIDFKGFIEVVDALGGVEVSLENNFVDYEYPDGNLGYKTFILRKGTWTLDGEVALMYARSRHSTSDFDRSLRQQEIISALREKVSRLGYFKDRKTFLELYNIFNEYVETDMSFTDMLSLGFTIKSWDSSKTLSFNLNDSCYPGSPDCSAGGFLYVPLREYFGGASVLLPNGATKNDLSNYDSIREYTRLIYTQTDIYTTPRNIIIFNATSTPLLAAKAEDLLRPYGFSIDGEIGTQTLREKKFEKSILYYNGITEDDPTLLAIQEILNIETEKTDIPLYSPTGTNIEIILAEDNF